MKTIEVVAAVIVKGGRIFATQRGYGDFKDMWEFPGGKVEKGERPEDALVREIKEELDADITVDSFIQTIEYDYPKFHLILHCYLCRLKTKKVHLLEHESSRWLSADELDSVDWLPADLSLISYLKTII